MTGFNRDVETGVGGAFKKVAGVAAAAIATAGIGSFFKGTISAAADAEQSIGGVEAVFKDYAKTVISDSKAADRQLGLSANSYRELATVIGAQLKNAGVPMSQLGENTDKLITQGADLAAMFGGTTEDAVRALSSALKGEMDPIERYGISLNEAALKAEAAALGIEVVGGTLTNSQKALVVQSLVTKQAADATGAFGRENDTAAGRAQRAAAQWENLKTSIGDSLLPAWSALMDFVGTKVIPGLSAVGEFTGRVIGGFKGIYDIIVNGDFTGAIQNAFGIEEDSRIVDVLFRIHDGFVVVRDFVRDNFVPIMSGMGAALAVIAGPTVIGALITAVGAVASFIGGALVSAFGALLSPIALTAIAVGGIVALFVQAYRDSEPLRDAIDKLKSAFGAFIDAFKSADAEGGVVGFFQRIKAGIEAAAPVVRDALMEMGAALWQWISENIGPALAALGGWLAAIGDWIWNTAVPTVVDEMTALGQALVDWIGPRIGPALAAIGDFIGALLSWIWDTGLPRLGTALADLGQALIDWIGPRIGPMLTEIGEFLSSLVNWIWDTGLPWLGEALADLGSAIVDWIGPRIVPMLAAIGEFLSTLVTWIWDDGLPMLWDAVTGLGKAAIDWILPRIPELLGNIGSFIGTLLGWIVGTGLPLLVGGVLKLGYELIAWILPRIPELLANIAQFIGSLLKWLITDGLPSLAKGLYNMAWEGIKSFWQALGDSPLLDEVGKVFNKLVDAAKRTWFDVANEFIGGVNNVIGLINKFLDAVNTIAGKVGINLGLHINPISTIGGSSVQGGTQGGGKTLFRADGGDVPGNSPHSRADNIPAMLTAGEWVQPVSAVNYYGSGIMEAIRTRSIPREALKLASGGLVSFGRKIQAMGAKVSRHSAFDGVTPKSGHGKSSLHYTDDAIDVNTRPGTSALEQRELDVFAKMAQDAGFRTIWRTKDHFNHLHVDVGKGGSLGGIGGAVQDALHFLAQKAADPIMSGIRSLTSGSPLLGMMGGAANSALQSVIDAIKRKEEEQAESYSATDVPAGGGTGDQVSNARIIAQTARSMGLGRNAVVVALATALQESGLKNINYGDRDSVGLFQQRPSQGWGSVAQIMNPAYSSRKFFEGLQRVPGWQSLPVTVAAQRVQRSAFPNAYAKWTGQANSLASAVGMANGGPVGLFDSGGVLKHGTTGVNLSGKPEAVLTNEQFGWLRDAASSPTQAPLIGGDLIIQPSAGESTRDQFGEAVFQLRRLARGGANARR